MAKCVTCGWRNHEGRDICEKCGEPLTFDVFISYSRKDYVDDSGNVLPGNMLSKIKDTFKVNNISFWFDEEGIFSSNEFASVLTKAIRNSRIILFVSSNNSNRSKRRDRESFMAVKFEKPIIFFHYSSYNDSIRIDIIQWFSDVGYDDIMKNNVEFENEEKATNELLNMVKCYLSTPHKEYIDDGEHMERLPKYYGSTELADEQQKNTVLPVHIPEPIVTECECCSLEASSRSVFEDGIPEEIYRIESRPLSIFSIFGKTIGFLYKHFLLRNNTFTYETRPIVKVKDERNAYSSIFAPAEVKRKSHMQIQVYLHLYEETGKVNTLAQESQKDTERRDYIPLQCNLKKGDKVDVHLNIFGETLLMSEKKSMVWQGTFTKCSFDYYVPMDIKDDEVSCMVVLSVNETPIGDMSFLTRIVNSPRRLPPNVI